MLFRQPDSYDGEDHSHCRRRSPSMSRLGNRATTPLLVRFVRNQSMRTVKSCSRTRTPHQNLNSSRKRIVSISTCGSLLANHPNRAGQSYSTSMAAGSRSAMQCKAMPTTLTTCWQARTLPESSSRPHIASISSDSWPVLLSPSWPKTVHRATMASGTSEQP